MTLILTVSLVFALLVGSEWWWRRRKPRDELSRKFIHIVVGSLAAFWPFYLSWNQILVLSVGFIVAVAVSKYFNIFKAIHAVERPTWGEVYFALAVGALVFITREPWIYAVALLHMSLADGLAAVVGVTFGRDSRYKVFGHIKSVVGSLTFLTVSIALLALYSTVAAPISFAVIVGLAAAATAIENVGVKGLDNLFVPVLVGVVLALVA